MKLRPRYALAALLVAAAIAGAAALHVHSRASGALLQTSSWVLNLADARYAHARVREQVQAIPSADNKTAWGEALAALVRAWTLLEPALSPSVAQAGANALGTLQSAPSLRAVDAMGAVLVDAQSSLRHRMEQAKTRLRAARWFAFWVLATACLTWVAGGLSFLGRGRPRPTHVTYTSGPDGHELEKFAARVAHDVLSPLQAAASAFEILGRTSDPDKLRRCEHAGKSSIKRVQRVVEGLVEFARSEQVPPPDARCVVDEVLGEVLDELGKLAEDESVELRTGEISRCVVAMEHGTLAMVLRHLIRNAIQYMPEKADRWIDVRAKSLADRIWIEISDSGQGILEEPSRLFIPYVRPKGSKKTGLGLGLATVKRTLEAHRGSIVVDSRPGEGTRFQLELPEAASLPAELGRPPYLT